MTAPAVAPSRVITSVPEGRGGAADRQSVAGRLRRYEALRTSLKAERSSFEAHWRELANLVKPRRARFQTTERNKGDRRSQHIITSHATRAHRTLVAGLMSGITSPSRPWFRLTTPNPDLAEQQGVKMWLHQVTQRMSTVFTRSNVYNVLPTMYGDLGLFSTAAAVVVDDEETVIRLHPFPIGTYYLGNDHKGRVRVFVREFRLTPRQLVEQFGRPGPGGALDISHLSEGVQRAYRDARGDSEQASVDVVHIVAPNDGYQAGRLGIAGKAFRSCYYEASRGKQSDKADDVFLLEEGFDAFPVLAPRWEVGEGDVYGTDGPGMTALPDVKQLTVMRKTGLKAAERMANPPLIAPAGLQHRALSALPGEVTYYDETAHSQVRSMYDVRFDLQHMQVYEADVIQSIKSAFFEDLFLMLDHALSERSQITATEIMERRNEKLLVLGPVLERLNEDLLNPLIDLTFAAMLRRGLIPEPPPELEGEDLRVEYLSMTAQAQQGAALAGIERTALFVGQLAAVAPEAVDKIDIEQTVDEYALATGVPPRMIRSDDDVATMRQARAEAAQQQQVAEQAAMAAKAARDLGGASTAPDTALGALLGTGDSVAAGAV